MDEGRDFALSKMRKSAEKLGSSAEGYEDPTLMRFLVARSMEPDKAAKMFVQWQKWRASLVPNGFISESEVADELETRKIFLQGLSQDKYPVMLVQTKKHFPAKDQNQFKKFVAYLLDKTIARYSNFTTMVVLPVAKRTNLPWLKAWHYRNSNFLLDVIDALSTTFSRLRKAKFSCLT